MLGPYDHQNMLTWHMIDGYDSHRFLSQVRLGARHVYLAKKVSRAPALTKAVDVEELYRLTRIGERMMFDVAMWAECSKD